MAQTEIQWFVPLFEDVQMQQVFPDGKTFVDCIPKMPLEAINLEYVKLKDSPGFDLKDFVHRYFELPPRYQQYIAEGHVPVEEHIGNLWNVLTRQPDIENGSLLPLPYPYIVPGGRFGEIYYWDSYFTMLGLKASGENEMLENMVKNFAFLIDTIGYIPNGNRTYYIGRSQPPFFSLMIELLATIRGDNIIKKYLPQLEKEYLFWTGIDSLSPQHPASGHTVLMPGDEILNRYWDKNDTPRPESYKEDVELAQRSGVDPAIVFRHLRAGAASGWDYSSRWFKEASSFKTIHTTDIVAIDLNALLFNLEKVLNKGYTISGNTKKASIYESLSVYRQKSINKYFWSNEEKFYFDYDIITGRQTDRLTLAGISPLFFQIADAEQANSMVNIIREKFLQSGGLLTTLHTTGQQWDAPNGWAPLHWMAIVGLENYGHKELARDIAHRWVKLNKEVYNRTGKLMEKYNVVDTGLEAGGGEYPGQDGFGWTNGVLLALIRKYKIIE